MPRVVILKCEHIVPLLKFCKQTRKAVTPDPPTAASLNTQKICIVQLIHTNTYHIENCAEFASFSYILQNIMQHFPK
jgi:hypothetical protein